MASITIPAQSKEHPHLRPLNVLRDLSPVADLIELCFAATMDNDGQRYVDDMRRASTNRDRLARWANHMAETTSLPLTGYVWDEDNRILGNASLIPFRDQGKRIYLIANVATHPDHRRRGIARLLTQRAVEHARAKNAAEVWLHVRDDNPGAIQLYADLGFREIVRRTTWTAHADSRAPQPFDTAQDKPDSTTQIVPRHPRFWTQQQDWLRRLHPDALNWYTPLNLRALKPGFWNWFYWLFMDFDLQQWASTRGDELLATVSWMPRGGRSESVYLAAPAQAADHADAVTQLLLHARRALSVHTTLTLEYPAGEMTEAIAAAGFRPRRTLIWMKI